MQRSKSIKQIVSVLLSKQANPFSGRNFHILKSCAMQIFHYVDLKRIQKSKGEKRIRYAFPGPVGQTRLLCGEHNLSQ